MWRRHIYILTNNNRYLKMNTIRKAMISAASVVGMILCIHIGMHAGNRPLVRPTLPNLHVNAIEQDSLGFVWVGTANGLSRCYTTGNFDVYFNSPSDALSLPHNNVFGLKRRGSRLWVATMGGVAVKDFGSNDFTTYPLDSAGGTAVACRGFVEYNGRFYAYGFRGLYLIDDGERLLRRTFAVARSVKDVCIDGSGRLWLATDGELICLNQAMKVSARVAIPVSTQVNCLLCREAEMLVGTDAGLLRYDRATRSVTPVGGRLSGVKVYTLSEHPSGVLMVGTGTEGLLAYDMASGVASRKAGVYDFSLLPSPDITVTFTDSDGGLWVGSFDKGVRRISSRKSAFNSDKRLAELFGRNFVTRIARDSRGVLWVGTRYEGFVAYDPVTGSVARYNSGSTPWLPKGAGDFVQELFCDSRDRLWIGYNNDIVVCQLDASSEPRPVATFKNVTNAVSAAEDSRGRVWMGLSDNGMMVFSPDVRLERHLNAPENQNITSILPLDGRRMLYSAFSDGLYVIDIEKMEPQRFEGRYGEQWSNAIALMRGGDGSIWVGTYGNGLLRYNPADGSLANYRDFRSSDIVALAQAPDNCIFASSAYGIYRLNPSTGDVNTYLEAQGTHGCQFHEKSVLMSPDGTVYFGGNTGVEQILTDRLRHEPRKGRLYLTSVEHLRSGADGFDPDGRLDYPGMKSLELGHKDNSVRLGFTGLDYDAPLEYAYKLEGFDKDWIVSGDHNQAIYSNLPAGNYTLLVKTRVDDVWGEPVRLLEISVSPSPWLHPAAKVAYFIILVLLIVLFNRMYLRIRLEKRRYKMAEEQVIKERDNTQRKINFFNNLSHEIRTPITLIYGPIKYLRRNVDKMPVSEVDSTLDYIERNADRLLTLTNQLLKFHDVQQDTLPLKVSRYDCVQQLEGIVRLYNIYAAEKIQTVEFVCPYKSYMATYDYDKLEKIVNNLLFNAIKYTPEGGHIMVKLEITKLPEGFVKTADYTYMEVQVIDDGIGMSAEQVPNLFQRFRRLVSNKSKINGYGVGLNYVKELVACHKGTVTPRKNSGAGMTFIVAIPIDDSAFSPSEHLQSSDVKTVGVAEATDDVAAVQRDPDAAASADDVERPSILIVEDNEELNDFLANLFRPQFDTYQATNGAAGLSLAREHLPDIVISDIVMPQMDGYELCETLKTDKDTCHIPVILLTAKTLDEDRITGFKVGADMYIDKPFNPQVIHSMVESLIARRDRIKHLVAARAGTDPAALEREELNPLDHKFLTKLYAYINDNMSNSELNVNILGKDLGFSRTNFYRKIKVLTGMTPNDLLRMCRLNRAAELLLTRQHTIGEISDITGFGTQSHFSSLFKKHFGMSPRDYVAANAPGAEKK